MKLSKHTLNMLRNFSDINMSIEIKQGNILRTVSVQKNILAQAELEDEFPQDFAIYELNRFRDADSFKSAKVYRLYLIIKLKSQVNYSVLSSAFN